MDGTDALPPLTTLRRALDAEDSEAVKTILERPERVLMYEAELDDLARTMALLETADGTIPIDLAWQAAYAHHLRGMYEESIAISARADTSSASPVALALLRSVEASSAWGRGDAEGCSALADEALDLAKRAGDDTALAYAWVARGLTLALAGDRTANIGAYRRALAHAEAAGDTAIQARIHCNLGSLANEECRHRGAMSHLEKAVQLTEQLGHRAILALSHFNLAESRIGLGLVDEALVDLALARELWQELDSPMVGIAAHGMGDTHRIRGNAAQAAAAYREAIRLAQENGIAQALVPAMASLARTTIDNDPAAATALVERALAQPAALGHVQTKLAAGWVALCLGDPDAARAFGAEAEHEAGLRRNPRGIAESLELAALADSPIATDGRLEEARAIWTDIESPIPLAINQIVTARLATDHRAEAAARARLRALGVRDAAYRVAGPLKAIGSHRAPPVEIRTLGTFTVLRDGHVITPAQWQSRKARDLVKILVSRRGRGASREVLADLLWPGVSLEIAANRLSVVLSHIRSAFDPDREHPPDRYVIADRAAVRLNRDALVIDADDFLDSARAALTTRRQSDAEEISELQQAASMYVGHFLEDDPHHDWSAGFRDELLSLSLELRREVARILAVSKRPDDAIPWLVGLLADDPYDEPTHRSLIDALDRAGRHGEARRFYRAYATRMSEIDVPATPFASLVGPDQTSVL